MLDASESDRLVVLRVLKPPAENGTGGEARPDIKNVEARWILHVSYLYSINYINIDRYN